MAVGLRLDLRQSQQLVMTPQLQQAIKLLQLSNMQLNDFVEGEVERNPLLTLDSTVAEERAPAQASAEPAAADRRTEDHDLAAEVFDTGTENLHDAPARPGHAEGAWSPPDRARSTVAAGDLPSLEETLSDAPSLRDHLRAQLGQVRQTDTSHAVALFLIEELDDHGFLRTPPEAIAAQLGTDEETVLAGLSLVQGCEPTGVGARDLAECLALQLHERGLLTAPMATLLEHVELLMRGEVRRLQKLCQTDADGLGDLLRVLRQTNPRPCAAFETTEAETLIPDVLLTRTDWGGWQVELNPDTLPRVLIDQRYAAEISRSGVEARHFLAECQSNANWLIKSLDQRARTIVKIGSEIVRQQEAFFNEGIAGLRPLTLKAVAEAVGMHESTVSRVTANKFMATERGIFELKFFFTNALSAGDGDVAAEAVRHRIKAMVDGEPACAILSDDAIVDKLARDGIEIARRTVAKYRKSLNIPSSVERRRQKSLSRSA